MFKYFLALAAAAILAAPAAAGMEAGDVVRMTKADVGDEVIIAQMRAAKARFVLTADDIVRLKKEGVSDTVLKTMIGSTRQSSAKGPQPAAKEGGEGPATENAPEAGDVGQLILENLDSRDYSVQVDPINRNVFYWKASAAEGREPLPARSSQVYRLAPGNYRLTWVAGADSHLVKVLPGKESRAALTRTSADGAEVVYLSLFEDGQRRGGGRLKVLAERPPAPAAEPPPPQTTKIIERHYYAVPSRPAACATSSAYSQPRHYDHGRSSRYNWLVPAFSYDWSRGRNRYAVGWGPSGSMGFTWHRQLGRSGYTFGWGW